MNSRLRMLAALAVAAVLSNACLQAQTQVGSRYGTVGISRADTRDSYSTAWDGLYAGVNIPVSTGVDIFIGASEYDLDTLRTFDGINPVDEDGWAVSLTGVFHKTSGDYKAYTALTLGTQRINFNPGFDLGDDSDSTAYYRIGVGVEWQATRVMSWGVSLNYADTFGDLEFHDMTFKTSGVFVVSLFGHLRFTERFGLEAGFSFDDDSTLGMSIGPTITF